MKVSMAAVRTETSMDPVKAPYWPRFETSTALAFLPKGVKAQEKICLESSSWI